MVFLIKKNGVKNILFHTSILPSVEHLTIENFFMLNTYKTLYYEKSRFCLFLARLRDNYSQIKGAGVISRLLIK